MDAAQFVQPELLAIAPAMNILGTFLKRSTKFSDEHIPLALGCVAVALATLYVFATVPVQGVREVLQAVFASLTQGVLCAGMSVYSHQLVKQERASAKIPPDDK